MARGVRLGRVRVGDQSGCGESGNSAGWEEKAGWSGTKKSPRHSESRVRYPERGECHEEGSLSFLFVSSLFRGGQSGLTALGSGGEA